MSDSSPVACARTRALIQDAGEPCALRWGSFAASLLKRVTGLVFLRLCARKVASWLSVCYLAGGKRGSNSIHCAETSTDGGNSQPIPLNQIDEI